MELNNGHISAYAAYANDKRIRIESSSGGIFTLIAQEVIKSGGVVYGIAMAVDCYSASYLRVTTENQLFALRGSKYFQAHVGDTYKRVKNDLDSGVKVLFSGTSCQVNGLKKYLNKEYNNLYCVDLICHGVPSPNLWRRYAEWREKENGGKLISVNFRCKDDSWVDFGMKEIHDNAKQQYISKDEDPYMRMFLRNYCLRPSCYACNARSIRYSDITLADFWGIESVFPEMDDRRGTSLVLVRTVKGNSLFNEISYNIKFKDVNYDDAVRSNPSEYKSPLRPPQRDNFFIDMNELEFYNLIKRYGSVMKLSFGGKIKRAIKKIAKYTHISVPRGGGYK